MLREDARDRSPTSSYAPAMPSEDSVLDDVFGDPAPAAPTTTSSLDDIFACSEPPSPTLAAAGPPQHVSDVPRLRSIHVTAGYRDGIADSKAAHVQAGFDEGFPLGAVLGLRVGWVLGALENMKVALRVGCARRDTTGTLTGLAGRLDGIFGEAREELGMVKLFGEQYFDGEGIWQYTVDEADGATTFQEVAAKHPLVAKWVEVVERLAYELEVDLEVLDRQGEHADGAAQMLG